MNNQFPKPAISQMFQKFKSEYFETSIAMFLAILSLYSLLKSGFYGDDALQSFTKGQLLEEGRTSIEQYFHNMKLMSAYRLSLIQLYHWVFVFIHNLIAFKFYILSLVTFNIFLFAYFTKQLTASRTYYFLALLLPPLFFQFRAYGDPILVFHGVIQTNFAFLLLSFIFLKKHLENFKTLSIIISIVFYFLALSTYETSYPLMLVHFLIIYFHRPSLSLISALRKWSPFLSIALILTILNLLVRWISSDTQLSATYNPHLSLKPFLLTFIRQLSSSFPLSYFVFDPHSLFHSFRIFQPEQNGVIILLLVISYSFLVSKTTLNLKNETSFSHSHQRAFLLLAVGFCILVFPAALIALSPSYQREITWGCGYTPVYTGYFGLILILFAGLEATRKFKIAHRASFWIMSSTLIGLGSASVTYINLNSNNRLIEVLNSFWHYPRSVLENSIKHGLFNDVPQDSFLFIQNNFPWDITPFFRDRANLRLAQERYVGGQGHYFISPFDGRRWTEITPQQIQGMISKKGNSILASDFVASYFDTIRFHSRGPGSRSYYFDYYADSLTNGYAVLAKIDDLFGSNTYLSGATARRATIFVQLPSYPGSYRNTVISGYFLNRNHLEKKTFFSLNENELILKSSGDGWKTFELQSPANDLSIDLKSLNINTIAKNIQPSFFWHPIEPKKYILSSLPNEVLHIGFEHSFEGSGLALPSVHLGEKFTIELLVKPEKNATQVAFSHILGNHPGLNHFEGFVIQQVNQNQNQYRFDFGNGKEWVPSPSFELNALKYNYIAVRKFTSHFELFVNGHEFKIPLSNFKNSDLPLYIGNFLSLDRGFKGLIPEVRIINRAISQATISKTWRKIQAY